MIKSMIKKLIFTIFFLPISVFAQIWDDGLAEKYIDPPGEFIMFSAQLGYDSGTRQKGIFFFLYPSNISSCSDNSDADGIFEINNQLIEGAFFKETFSNSDNCYFQILPRTSQDLNYIINQFINLDEVVFKYHSFEILVPTEGFKDKWNSMDKEAS